MLHYARGITESFAGAGQVLDCVITVPAYFGQTQRQAISEAARLAGLTVLSLVNNHAAAALQHGIARNFANKTEHVIFYDMGASSVEAALIKYSSYDVKEFGKVNTHSQFEVKDVAWDANAGAQYLDMLLVNHFADQFEAKHAGSDVRSNPRAVAKLKRQVSTAGEYTHIPCTPTRGARCRVNSTVCTDCQRQVSSMCHSMLLHGLRAQCCMCALQPSGPWH